MTIVQLNRRAIEQSERVVAQLTPDQLDNPTPCADWKLRDLLAHLIVQHHGFAAAAEGKRTEHSDWESKPLGDDPVGEYAQAVDRVLTAFAADGAVDRTFHLPEFQPQSEFPGSIAIGMHFVDSVIHTWDAAKAIGVDPGFPEDLAEAVLPLISQVPAGDDRPRTEDFPFAPDLPIAGDAPALDRAVAFLGRSPSWPA